jgi:hypothetical protein
MPIPHREDEVASASHEGREFRIVFDPTVGFYLYIFEGERCIRDYLQDTGDAAIQVSNDMFGVPLSAWKRNEN